MATEHEHIKWFRDSSPYIDAHRKRTFVIYIGDDAFESENLSNIISDIALLNSLGVRVVIVHGATRQIDTYLNRLGLPWNNKNGVRITSEELIIPVSAAISVNRVRLEAELSKGITNSPVKGREITTASGNYIKAKPLGIIQGIDYQNTGVTRKVNHKAIATQLDDHAIVIISPLGYSPSGEIFNLSSMQLAKDVASSLLADKLIYLTEVGGILAEDGSIINEIDLSEVTLAASHESIDQELLGYCQQACRAGVERCHIISHGVDGAILEELFTRDGCGTQVVTRSYEQVRGANPDDVAGILNLIEPLESKGILVKRSRELIESEIDRFIVIDRDGLLVACAALYEYEQTGELACLVTHPEYRKGKRGDRLLDAIIKRARTRSIHQLFVLTTQSADWFRERNFRPAGVDALPASKKELYNWQRNSKVLLRDIS